MFNEHKQTRVYLLTPRLLSGHESDKASPLVVAIFWFLANVLYVSNIVWKKSEWRITKTKWISSITYLFTGLTPFNTFKIPVRISIASLSERCFFNRSSKAFDHLLSYNSPNSFTILVGLFGSDKSWMSVLFSHNRKLSTSPSLCKSLNMCVQIENRFLILKISSFNT